MKKQLIFRPFIGPENVARPNSLFENLKIAIYTKL